MRMAGAEDRDKYRPGLARTKKSTSTSKMSWALKTSRRISVPTTDSTWPISRSREMPIFVWYGAARFRKLNSTCATVESITLVRLATSPARGGPQPACTFGIRTAICGNLSSTSNRIMRKERHSWNIGDSDLLRCLLLASGATTSVGERLLREQRGGSRCRTRGGYQLFDTADVYGVLIPEGMQQGDQSPDTISYALACRSETIRSACLPQKLRPASIESLDCISSLDLFGRHNIGLE